MATPVVGTTCYTLGWGRTVANNINSYGKSSQSNLVFRGFSLRLLKIIIFSKFETTEYSTEYCRDYCREYCREYCTEYCRDYCREYCREYCEYNKKHSFFLFEQPLRWNSFKPPFKPTPHAATPTRRWSLIIIPFARERPVRCAMETAVSETS